MEKEGRFGIHGGQYIPETLMNAVNELSEAYDHYKNDPEFNRELQELFNEYANRPSRLYFAKKMTEDLGGAKIYLKREDLNHTGAHKINNVLGQALLAKKMGKTRLIAETGAGQHGVATATAAALMGMECVVFMGEEDTKRQALNVYRMRLLGAEVIPVKTGTATLKDAVSEAMREWTNRVSDTHYCLGSVMGPHPFPTIVRDFQAVISKEIKEQIRERINYDLFRFRDRQSLRRVDEIISLMSDTLVLSPDGKLRIGSTQIEIADVQQRYLSLGYDHIDYVLQSLDEASKTQKIRNIRRYLATALYNAPSTIDHYYSNRAIYDMNHPDPKGG